MANEKRLIDANALKSEFEWLKSVVNESSKYEIQEHIQRIEDAPTVDAVEVVHGRWEDANGIPKSKCGNCKVEFGRTMAYDCDYCPKCGAKMDGDGNA